MVLSQGMSTKTCHSNSIDTFFEQIQKAGAHIVSAAIWGSSIANSKHVYVVQCKRVLRP
jgi:hypothetical protein